ncbi:MAG: Asp-tRNA(Asn)/Glu-tRNA(Gln) amidotransferase subunit GatA [Candidatus Saccharibacteria bacterium]|nr:Asp-tRNA(Asn)/Glu-tRNA(Gln) amidotransferase subunit GatA [Candidatus Saccharibacteria bacterium]
MSKVENKKSKVWDPIADIASAVNSGKVSAIDNVKKSLDLIEKLNPEYNAIISTLQVRALERAKEIDALVASGKDAGRLAGVPFIAKDNFLVFGAETTAASNMLKGFIAPYQATSINKLEAAGAICVAKANLDAFAHGGSTENSDYFVTKNPHDKTRVAGGSSGGSAASVALELAPFALGSDTGGSIRQPASYCGVVGYKPTYGLVSRSGVVAMASSTDCIGPFASNVEDVAEVLEVMSGQDNLDGTTIERDKSDYTKLDKTLKGTKIGVIKEYFGDGLDTEVAESIKNAIKVMQKAGAEIVDISIPSIDLALAIYYVVVPAELSSNLSRHDGQRYQYSSPDAKTLNDSYELSRSQGFGTEAKRRIMIGTHVLSSGYYDAYYKKAQIVRTKLMNEFSKVLSNVDFLIGPVAPTPAFKIGDNSDPVQMYLQDIYSVAANLVGVPAISIPCGFSSDGMPIGMQIMAAQKKDLELLSFAAGFQEINK